MSPTRNAGMPSFMHTSSSWDWSKLQGYPLQMKEPLWTIMQAVTRQDAAS